jgi:thiol-disulfide isomerase/thioredoxin
MRTTLKSLLTTLFILYGWVCNAQCVLTTLDGKPIDPLTTVQTNYTVLIFMLPDCPACQSYIPVLAKLKKKYVAAQFRFMGVFAGKYSNPEEANKFQSTYQPPFPLYTDNDHCLIKELEVTVAPQAVIIDRNRNVVYSGRIDDWLYAVGKKRSIVRQHDLENALDQLSRHGVVSVKKTTPIGCIIE